VIRASIYAAAFAALAWSLAGCAGGVDIARHAIAQGAHVVPDSADLRITHQDDLDAECRAPREDGSRPTFAEWRACMEPAYRIDRAAATFAALLLASESALDASGEKGFRAMAPCLIEAARELSDAFTAAGLPVPDKAAGILDLAQRFGGECAPQEGASDGR